jgi:hypothetical protein
MLEAACNRIQIPIAIAASMDMTFLVKSKTAFKYARVRMLKKEELC